MGDSSGSSDGTYGSASASSWTDYEPWSSDWSSSSGWVDSTGNSSSVSSSAPDSLDSSSDASDNTPDSLAEIGSSNDTLRASAPDSAAYWAPQTNNASSESTSVSQSSASWSDIWNWQGFGVGLLQGGANLLNGVQDVVVGVINIPSNIANGVANSIDTSTAPHDRIRMPTVPSPDWSRNLLAPESGTPGAWDDTHGWSKFAAGEGATTLISLGAGKLGATLGKGTGLTDDAAKAADDAARAVAPKSVNQLSKSQQNAVNSLTERAAEHQKKLADYMNNPDAFDNQGLLKNAPTPEIRQKIIDGRIRHLQQEIKAFQDQIDQILGDR